MKQKTKIVAAIMIALFGAALLLRPSDAAAAVRDGLALCARAVIPALFPFFVASSLVVECGIARALGRFASPLMRPLFGISGNGTAALLAGLLGGYPAGARCASELYERGELSARDANRLLLFCNNAGPAFLIGYCGTTLGGTALGIKLYIAHAASALLIGIAAQRVYAIRRRHHRDWSAPTATAPPPDAHPADALVTSIKNALTATLSVCAFVVFFSVVTNLLYTFGLLPLLSRALGGGIAEPLLRGLVEMTGGIAALGAAQSAQQTCAAAAIVSLGGLCVLCQTFAVMRHPALSRRRVAVGKLLHAAAATTLAFFIF